MCSGNYFTLTPAALLKITGNYGGTLGQKEKKEKRAATAAATQAASALESCY